MVAKDLHNEVAKEKNPISRFVGILLGDYEPHIRLVLSEEILKKLKMNKHFRVVKFLFFVLLLISLSILIYGVYIKINVLDIYYYRVEVFDCNEEVTFYRYEIDSAVELLNNLTNIVFICSILLVIVSIYEFRKRK